jgi:diadenosine tetraphosphate (Ap4A) HIT family hydrolase
MNPNTTNLSPFVVDNRITSSCFQLADLPLSRVFLKNNAQYPWIILVPRVDNAQEIIDLPSAQQTLLIREINAISHLMRDYFRPDKLNVATLGNQVAQLHLHVVARFTHDTLWPDAIWQAAQTTTPYTETEQRVLLTELPRLIERWSDFK